MIMRALITGTTLMWLLLVAIEVVVADSSASDLPQAENRRVLQAAYEIADPETPEPAEIEPPSDPLPQPVASSASTPADPWLFLSGPIRVKLGFEAMTQPSGNLGSWWRLSDTFAPDENYSPDRFWTEGWIKNSLRTDVTIDSERAIYGGVSYVGSGTLGRDVFEEGYRGLYAIEDGYLGARYSNEADTTIDFSYGRQQYKIASGMLISVGAYNGFERGALTTFARRAWEEAGLLKVKSGEWSTDVFYLNPNELNSGDTHTQLVGNKFEWSPDPNQYTGMAYLHVLNSIYPYLAAPLRLIPDGRDGLNTLHFYTRRNILADALPGSYIAGDFAYQWNTGIDMSASAWNAEIGRRFEKHRWKPTLLYGFRYFSGDDPETVTFEKFDPLFYEGAPPLWASGSNGSFAFLNSNVLLHRIALMLTVTERDFVNFYYWHVRAAQIDSPLQFGQSGRIGVVGGEPSLVAGVPDAHLSDDFYVDWTRMLSPNVFLTTGFAASIPGSGLRMIGGDETWYGALVNLSLKY